MKFKLNWQRLIRTKSKYFVLGLIVILAFGLRVWGISFGLPYIYHFDEHFYINTALKLGTGVLHNPPHAPVGFANILFGEYASYFVIGKVLGFFDSGQEFEAAFRTDPSMFYVIGRSTSALLGSATVLALYMLGRYASHQKVGLMAAAFLAVSFLHVRDSHYAVNDVAMAFFVVLSVTLATIGLRRNLRIYIYLSALAGGLAVAMKWTALPICLAVGWASLWVEEKDRRSLFDRLLNWTVILTIILFAVGFAVGSPQILINPTPYINEAFGQLGADRNSGFGIWLVDDSSGWIFYLKTAWYGVGPALLITGIVGIVWQLVLVLKTKEKVGVLLLLFPLTYYLLMGSTRHYFARYSIPLIPFVALFSANFIYILAIRVNSRQAKVGWGRVALAILVLLIAVPPFLHSIQHNRILTRSDTRTLAKEWIEQNIPSGTKIAVDWPTHGPPLSTTEKRMPDSDRLYIVNQVGGTGLSDNPLTWYREQDFEYLIATSFIYKIPLVFENADAERQAFYASLDQKLELIHEFRPAQVDNDLPFIFDEIYGPAISLWQRERPGPTIKVYALTPEVENITGAKLDN